MNLITLGIDTIDPKKFEKIKNRRISNKPIGGLWCSPEKGDFTWKDFVKSENYRVEHYFSKMVLLTLKKSSKIFKIDSINDFISCIEHYSYSNEKLLEMYKDDNYKSNYLFDIKYLIDYEKLSKNYDALWVTTKVLFELEEKSYMQQYLNPLFGWDVETVLLFNLNCIESYA